MLKGLIALFSNKDTNEDAKVATTNDSNLNQNPVSTAVPKINLSNQQIDAFVAAEIKCQILNCEQLEIIRRPDNMLEEAARLVILHNQGSASLIKRKLKIDFNRAGKIVDQLEELGILSPFDGLHHRSVYITSTEELELILNFQIRSTSLEREYFKNEILPTKTAFIEQRVQELRLEKLQEHNKQMKIEIRNELLSKELQQLEKLKMQELKQQVMEEMIDRGEIRGVGKENYRLPISQEVKDMVWNRDRGRCVICNGNEKLEFDHLIPYSKGGSDTYRNIQLLCEACNRSKSDKIGG